ncbi:condensation domain-containing protein [Tumebacillus permanentifrigoris]|uniref:Phosphopantetheine binding protein n=1 Tax=Tumebacillus permanentifrigoris TaxID=378543 RepID=A0A316DB90_9BACL|nr:condensation domain-containing protein [Tumebacillus permanentifrigoris]PWK11294.1 phosphopantetheine binding protein [Tumebacillus permanentifrigoris]
MNTSIEGYRLSPQQKRVWNTSRTSQLQMSVLVEGSLQPDLLAEALEELVHREEVLRTVFHKMPGLSIPVQVVLDEVKTAWTVYENVQSPDIERILNELSLTTCDLEKGPLLRAALLSEQPERGIVVLQVPALHADPDSKYLVHEWFRLYEARVQQQQTVSVDAEEEAITYTVISEWLNQLLEDEESDTGRAFWSRQRLDAVPALHVPWQLATENQEQVLKSQRVSGNIWQELARTASQWNVQTQDLVLLAWRTVWQRVSGQSEIVMGLSCDGRTDEGVETALGLMTRYVPLTSHWNEEERVQDAAVRLSRVTLEAYEWQESWSWELTTPKAGTAAERGMFQIGFESRERWSDFEVAGVRVSLLQERGQVEPFEALLSCYMDADGAELTVRTDGRIWPEEAVNQWLFALLEMLEQLSTDSHLRCGELRFWHSSTKDLQAAALRGQAGSLERAEDDGWLYVTEHLENYDLWRPLPDVQVRVVDASGEWVPLGAVGVIEARKQDLADAEWTTLSRGRLWPGGRLERMQEELHRDGELSAPRNEVERGLAAIWSEVLGVEEIDVHDNFFDLGGHSLLATQVVIRMRATYGVEFPMRIVFETKTLEALAQAVERAVGAQTQVSATSYASIPRLPEQALYPLSPSQERLWFSAQLSTSNQFGSGFYYVIEGELHTDCFARAFEALVARHAIMRTTIEVQDGVAYQRLNAGVQPHLHQHDVQELPESEQLAMVRESVLDVWTTPFNLSNESFFRFELYRLSPQKSLLFLCAHHIGYDGWAVRLLIRDLNEYYSAFRRGEDEVKLPEVVPFADAAAWMHQRLADGELQSQLDYWLTQLRDDVQPPSLPGDTGVWARNPLDVRTIEMSSEITARLNQLAQDQGSSLYATVLSGVMAWLSRLSRETLVTVGATLSGRTHPELEEVFGPMINPVAMRTDLSGNPTCAEMVARAAQTSFDAYANQDYPFDLLWQELRKRGAKAASLYSVILIGQNVTDGEIRLNGMRLKPQPLTELLADRVQEAVQRLYGTEEAESSAYELVMSMREVDGGIVLEANYAVAKFRPETVDRFLEQIVQVLEQFSTDPELRLSQLQIEEAVAEDAWEELF